MGKQITASYLCQLSTFTKKCCVFFVFFLRFTQTMSTGKPAAQVFDGITNIV